VASDGAIQPFLVDAFAISDPKRESALKIPVRFVRSAVESVGQVGPVGGKRRRV
jgi:hypothetical protein